MINRISNIRFSKFALLYYFMYIFLKFDTISSPIVYYSPYVLLVISILLLFNGKVYINTYIEWRVIFCLACLFSYLFISIDKSVSFLYLKIIIMQTVVFIQIGMLLREIGIVEILKMYILSVFLMIIYIFFRIDYSELGSYRLGEEVLGAGWNANVIGLTCYWAWIFIYIVIKYEHYIRNSTFIIYLFMKYTCILIIFLTGSRKALIALVSSYLLLAILDKKGIIKKIIFILIALVGIWLLIYFINRIPFLYNIIGKRINSLLVLLETHQYGDSSLMWRDNMIQYGIEFFEKSPVFGYGINCFRVLFGYLFSNKVTYAHNNYIEMLVGGGVIGFILYYWIYIYIYIKAFNSKSKYRKFVMLFLGIALILDFATVSYTDFSIQFVIFISTYMLLNPSVGE